MLLRVCIIVALLLPLFVGCDEFSDDDDKVAVRNRNRNRRKKNEPLPPPPSAAEREEKSQSKGRKRKKPPQKKTAAGKQPADPTKSTLKQKQPDVDAGKTFVEPRRDSQPTPGGSDPTEEFLAEVTPAVREARMDDATNFLCAVCLGHAEKDTVQQYLRWSPALGRPVMGITWGLGVRVKYPKGNKKGVPDVRWRLRGDVRSLSGQIPQIPLADTWSYFTGELGDEIHAELLTRLNNGDFGQAYAVAGKSSSGREFREKNGRYPGLTWLGQGGPSSGSNSRVDLLLTISLSAAAKGTEGGGWYTDITGTPTLRDVRGGRSLKKWKTIMTGAGGGASFKAYIAEIAKYIDENLVVTDFPERETKAIHARAQILGKKPKHKDSLIELAELQYYYSKEQIDDRQKEYVFKKILGDDLGKRLAGGTQEQKIAVLQQLLPRVRSAK